MIRSTLPFLLATLALVGCKKTEEGSAGGGGGGEPRPVGCGNGVLNGFEPCDRTAFLSGSTCADYGLGAGNVSCSFACTLDFSGCAATDYCTANGLVGDGLCDACDLLGGAADTDCQGACAGGDATCGERLDPLTGVFVCAHAGAADPDCGTCGNGAVEGVEVCDGAAFASGDTCADYGFARGGGVLTCGADCLPSFGGCRTAICGNGTREAGEACDAHELGGKTCEDFGGFGSDLRCTSSCEIDTGDCTLGTPLDPTQLIGAWCGFYDRCASTLGPMFASLTDCTTRISANAECDPLVGTSQSTLNACASALSGAACVVSDGLPTALLGTPSCIEALLGIQARVVGAGQTCGFASASCEVSICQSGAFCADTGQCATTLASSSTCGDDDECASGWCKDTVCTEPIAKNGACGPDDRCAGLLACLGGTCSDRLPAGSGTCDGDEDCQSGSECAFGTCTAFDDCTPRGAGVYCDDDDDCASTMYCDFDSDTCQPLVGEGDACSDFNACAPELYCSTTCQPRAVIDESCATARCLTGLRCDYTDDVCRFPVEAGGECDSDLDCQSYSCVDLRCEASAESACGL